jgi:hypothetical protein
MAATHDRRLVCDHHRHHHTGADCADWRETVSTRPNREDRDALRLLLQREDLSDYNAEFVESLRNWSGTWTEKQCRHFDQLWSEYYA